MCVCVSRTRALRKCEWECVCVGRTCAVHSTPTAATAEFYRFSHGVIKCGNAKTFTDLINFYVKMRRHSNALHARKRDRARSQPISAVESLKLELTCRLAISERPARFHTTLAGGLASASHRSTNESLPSSRSICGAPSSRMVGASVHVIKENFQCIFFFRSFSFRWKWRKGNKTCETIEMSTRTMGNWK